MKEAVVNCKTQDHGKATRQAALKTDQNSFALEQKPWELTEENRK
jgi:hypothetical protein